MNSRLLHPILTGILGIAIGLILGTSFSNPKGQTSDPAGALQESPIRTNSREHGRSVADSEEPPADFRVSISASPVPSDFPKRAAKVLQINHTDLRNAETVKLVRQWAAADKTAASAWVLSLPTGAARSAAVRAFAETVAREDAASAMEFLSANLEDGASNGACHNILAEWARQDPAAALNWATNAGTEGPMLAAVALSNVPADSFSKVVSAVSQMPDGPLRTQLQSRLATTWAARDRTSALAWAETMPPGSREPVLAEIAAQVGSNDPAAALSIIGKLKGDERNAAVSVLAGQWGHADPLAASRWVASLQNESEQRAGAEQLVDSWAKQNSNEAARWLDSLPPGSTRDVAVARFVGIIAAWDLESALVYAGTISNEGERRSVVSNLEGRARKDRK